MVGLAALALWLLLQAGLGIGSSSKKRWARSLVSLGKAVTYLALASTGLSLALRHPTDAATSTRQASGTVLSLPGGQLLLIAAGLITAGIGGYFVYKGARKSFTMASPCLAAASGRLLTCSGLQDTSPRASRS